MLRVLGLSLPAGLLVWILVGAAGLLGGCNQAAEADSHEHGLEIGSQVQLLSTTRGELAEQSIRRLLPHGRAVLPYLEASLHTAKAQGRKNLIVMLRRLGLAESVPLLGHVAAYDEDHVAAREAWRTLELWSSERSARGDSARKVLYKVDEVRGTGALLLDP